MEKIDHIGIAVKSIEDSLPYYIDTLGLKLVHIEDVVSEKVRVAFIDSGNVHLELLQPIDDTSTIHSFIEKKGEGIHHIAFGVTSIQQRLDELKDKGVRLIQETAKAGAHGTQVAFIHPKASHGVLYELVDKTGGEK
jgi:methylmalonyl-CoA/ethylmalonyl-CoA epimerase